MGGRDPWRAAKIEYDLPGVMPARRIAVDVAAIDDQIVRHLADRGLQPIAVAELDDVVERVGAHDLEELKAVMVRAGMVRAA